MRQDIGKANITGRKIIIEMPLDKAFVSIPSFCATSEIEIGIKLSFDEFKALANNSILNLSSRHFVYSWKVL